MRTKIIVVTLLAVTTNIAALSGIYYAAVGTALYNHEVAVGWKRAAEAWATARYKCDESVELWRGVAQRWQVTSDKNYATAEECTRVLRDFATQLNMCRRP